MTAEQRDATALEMDARGDDDVVVDDDAPESGLQRLMRAGKRSVEEAGEIQHQHHGGSFQKYMAAKIQKLEHQYEEQRRRACGGSGPHGSGERSQGIFSGVAIHVNGFTTPPHEELKHIMTSHGGRFVNYVRPGAVTHIICSNYSDASLKRFEAQRNPPPVVRPEWITDSLKAGKRLQIESYLLSRLRDAPGQRVLQGFATGPGRVAAGAMLASPPWPPGRPGAPADLAGQPLPSDASTAAAEYPAGAAALDAQGGARAAGPGIAQEPRTGHSPLSREDLSLRMAQRVAERARARCDVLKMGVRSTRDDPNFMETFYKSSRLHFIGTWKARNEALVEKLSGSGPQPSVQLPLQRRLLLPSSAAGALQRTIIHLDMDAFFASVAGLEHPSLAGKPLAVSHSNSDASSSGGEISSANYAARALGIRAGMWMGEAKRLCPELLVMPYQFGRYQEISDKVYSIMLKYTAAVQPVSCDEAFLDVTGLGDAQDLAKMMREEIFEATDCTASAGIGPNMLVARLATKKAKPNGQFQVSAAEAGTFVRELPVSDLPGVGYRLGKTLRSLGIETCEDVLRYPKDRLEKAVGDKTSCRLKEFAASRDDRPVKPPGQRKSVGAEVNWGVRFQTKAEADTFLEGLAGEVSSRLKEAGVLAKSLTLKLKKRAAHAPVEPRKFLGHGVCDNMSKSGNLSRHLDDPAEIAHSAKQLLWQLKVPPDQIRGIGISMSRLVPRAGGAAGTGGAGAGQETALDRFLMPQPSSKAPGNGASCKPGAPSDDGGDARPAAPGGSVGGLNSMEDERTGAGHVIIDGVSVNPAVLAALPEEMRAQVLSSTAGGTRSPDSAAGRSYEGIPRNRSLAAEQRQQQRQASGGLAVAAEGAGSLRARSSVYDEEALPPASQLDPAVLQELPPEYVEELRKAYGVRELHSHARSNQGVQGQGAGRLRNWAAVASAQNPAGGAEPVEWWKQPRAASGGIFGRVGRGGGRGGGRGAAGHARGAALPRDPLCQQRRKLQHRLPPIEDTGGALPITMSQVDPEVLAELPAEFQAEVMESLRNAEDARKKKQHRQQAPANPCPPAAQDKTPPSSDTAHYEKRVKCLIAELEAQAAQQQVLGDGLCPVLQKLLAPISTKAGANLDPGLVDKQGAEAVIVVDGTDSEDEEIQRRPMGWILEELEEVLMDWSARNLPRHADEVSALLMEIRRAAAQFRPVLGAMSDRVICRVQEKAVQVLGGPLRIHSLFELRPPPMANPPEQRMS